jgi:hypothetical protein
VIFSIAVLTVSSVIDATISMPAAMSNSEIKASNLLIPLTSPSVYNISAGLPSAAPGKAQFAD